MSIIHHLVPLFMMMTGATTASTTSNPSIKICLFACGLGGVVTFDLNY